MRELFAAIHQLGHHNTDTCGDCTCQSRRWHGLPCTNNGCQCPTSFVDKHQEDSA